MLPTFQTLNSTLVKTQVNPATQSKQARAFPDTVCFFLRETSNGELKSTLYKYDIQAVVTLVSSVLQNLNENPGHPDIDWVAVGNALGLPPKNCKVLYLYVAHLWSLDDSTPELDESLFESLTPTGGMAPLWRFIQDQSFSQPLSPEKAVSHSESPSPSSTSTTNTNTNTNTIITNGKITQTVPGNAQSSTFITVINAKPIMVKNASLSNNNTNNSVNSTIINNNISNTNPTTNPPNTSCGKVPLPAVTPMAPPVFNAFSPFHPLLAQSYPGSSPLHFAMSNKNSGPNTGGMGIFAQLPISHSFAHHTTPAVSPNLVSSGMQINSIHNNPNFPSTNATANTNTNNNN